MTEQPSTSQPLHGVRVVELATGVAGCYLGKLWADLGAEVVKVEPVGAGNPVVVVDLRKRGPMMSGCVAVCIAFSLD